jgi:hypothetical protein
MASLVDIGYLDALRSALDTRNKAIGQLGQNLLGGAAQIGGAAIQKGNDVKRTQADLDAMSQALQTELGALTKQGADIQAQITTAGPYERAELESKLSDIAAKRNDVSAQMQGIGAIGDVTRRNVYDIQVPKLAQRDATSYKGQWADIEADRKAAKEQKDAEAAAKKAADLEAKWAAEFEQKERLGAQKANERVGATIAIEQAKTDMQKQAAKAEAQDKALKAHEKVSSTLGEMRKLIDQYGDTLFASESAFGKIRDTLGTAAGTDAQAARDQFDNLESELTEMAVEARKGTGTISDADLAVIQRGGVSRRASSAKAALAIIDRIGKKSAEKTRAQALQPARKPAQLAPGESVMGR